ncbi:hypothetical protein PRZ48_003383 [Zasmidium cellare]|uniref:Uncharacterized protein n=1 Tax=Zasmidium cellare TaxID=395010 RepID=A0ABR0EVY1_ZASCE|nr:hypothetical protein PRZ48_003383 [Zasmidium cellare]
MLAQVTGIGAQYIDDTYPDMLGFFSDDPKVSRPDGTLTAGNSRAVSQSDTFGNTAFQYGSRGLHGCTMVAVISNRGVWMAQFWESYSNSDGEGANHDTVDQVLRQRVLMAIQGQTVTNPINPSTDPRNQYITPEGPALDPSLFNREDDNTNIYFMTPLDGSVTTANKKPPKPPSGPAMYPNKMRAIADTINELIGGVLEDVVQYNYWRLNYANSADEALIDTTERGLCMFQYDPNAFGSGKKGWRLFYEDRHYVSNEGDVV